MSADEWLAFARRASFYDAREKARALGRRRHLGLRAAEDAGGLLPGPGRHRLRDRQVAGRRAVRRHAVDGDEDRRPRRREAVRRRDPRAVPGPDAGLQPLAVVQLGHDRHERRGDARFPEELGKIGFVFNFITYGGHQIDGLAGEEFATALKQDGMLALARLQRKFRLVESPYRTPQTLVGGPRLDGALMAASGRTATTKAMGKGSTQFQHLVQTEVPPKLLEEWLGLWARALRLRRQLRVELRPHTAGSELLELRIVDERSEKVANVIFAPIPGPPRPEHPLGARPEHLRRDAPPEAPDDLVHLF